MPSRQLVAKDLAELFKAVAHPDRIRLIEELRSNEKDVNTLAGSLELPGPRVSQHLALLRLHRFVDERRDGRHRFYHLTQPDLAKWIIDGLDFIEGRMAEYERADIKTARELWASLPDDKTASA